MKHPRENAGFRFTRRSAPGRGWVTVYNATEADLDANSGAWAVVCETHSTILGVDTRADAESVCRSGSVEFCEGCRRIVEDQLALSIENGGDEPSIGEQAGRWRKIAHLLAALYKHEIPMARALRLGHNQLAMVAKLAGVHSPSGTTIKLLRHTLRKVPPPREPQPQ
jgi:hypothetical protein